MEVGIFVEAIAVRLLAGFGRYCHQHDGPKHRQDSAANRGPRHSLSPSTTLEKGMMTSGTVETMARTRPVLVVFKAHW